MHRMQQFSPRTRVIAPILVIAALATGIAAWTDHGSDAVSTAGAAVPAKMSQADITTQEIAYFTERAERDPKGASDRATLAGLYLQRSRETGDFGDYARAEQYARESIAIRTTRNAHAYRVLAAALLTQHRFADARAAAQELVDLFPDEPSHRALLGEVQLELGDYAAAGSTFASLSRVREHMAVAPRLARWAELRGDRQGEAAALSSVAHKALYRGDLPREQVAWFQLRLADHQIRFGEFDTARQTIATGLVEEPNDYRLISLLARIEALHGNWRGAIAIGERLGDAADLRTLALVGDAHAALGDSAAAEQWYQRLEESVAERPEPFNRQWSQFRVDHRRNLPEMVALLRRESAERPDMLGHDLLAWALYQSGDYAGARDAITRALDVGTQEGTLYFHGGMIELALGNRDAGRRYLRHALDINPRFHHVYAPEARRILSDPRRILAGM